MNNKYFFLIWIVCFLGGCADKKGQQIGRQEDSLMTAVDSQSLAIIDVTKSYPEKVIYVEDVASVEYVPLETNDQILLEGCNVDAISSHYIVTHNIKDGTVFIFGRDGKIINSFNHKGGGGEEYTSIRHVALDDRKREIYILAPGFRNTLYIYSLTGEFIRKFKLPAKIFLEFMFDYDDDYLLCFDAYGVDFNTEVKVNERPYFRLSKQDGKIIPLNLSVKNRIGNSIMTNKGDQYIASEVYITHSIKNGAETVIADYACDTIYSVTKDVLTPIGVKQPAVYKNDIPVLVFLQLLTSRYLCMSTMKKQWKYGEILDAKHIMLDRKTKELFSPAFLFKDIKLKNTQIITNSFSVLPHNYALWPINAESVLRLNEEGRLGGELKKIAAGLSPDDNAVLVLIKFKN